MPPRDERICALSYRRDGPHGGGEGQSAGEARVDGGWLSHYTGLLQRGAGDADHTEETFAGETVA